MKRILFFIAFIFSGTFFLCAQQAKLILPVAHTNKLEDVFASMDEKYVATVDLDGVIKFWEIATARLFQTFRHPSAHDVLISPDNKYVISGSLDHTLWVWDVESGAVFKKLEKHPGAISCLALSPDGNKIVSGDQQGNVVMWDTKTFQPDFLHATENGYVADINFSEDGKKFVVAATANAYVWDISQQKPSQILKGHAAKIHAANFSPDNSLIVTASWDHTARLWNVVTGKVEKTFTGHTESVFDAQFSPDGKSIATGSNDNTIRFWDIKTGQTTKTLTGHKGWVTKLRFLPDGKSLISLSFDHTARIWNYPSGNLVHELKGHRDDLYYISILRHSNKVLIGSYDNDISRWDIATGKQDFLFGLHNETITSVTIANTKNMAAVTYRDGRVKLINLDNGAVAKNINAHTEWATSVLFNYNDSMLVTAGTDNKIRIWDIYSDKMIEEIRADASWIHAEVQWSPDRRYLLSSGGETLTVYNLSTGEQSLQAKGSNLSGFSKRSEYFFTVIDSQINISKLADKSIVTRIKLNTDYPVGVFFSPDEKYIMWIDSNISVYDVKNGKLERTISVPGTELTKAYWMKNGMTLAASNKNSRLFFIDFETGIIKRELQLDTLKFHDYSDNDFMNDIVLSEDETLVASRHYDYYCLWNVTDGRFIGLYPGELFNFIPRTNRFLVANLGILSLYDSKSGGLVYKHFIAGQDDHIAMDSAGRYDGTETARKLLYFTCGTEVVELESVKDQLWVPDLAERSVKGDNINAKTLNDLNLCGLTPQVENISDNDDNYRFKIIPRKGGLGELVLMVNGIEARRYLQQELKKTGNGYELLVKKEELSSYFINGQENHVTIKAYTSDNTISSRGIKINENKTKQNTTPPNLYAVMIGVSDYKGDELDLKYAAKDANDISNALAISAKKLLNTDSKEHVFMYNLTTEKEHYQLPEKNSIKKTLEEIGKKATANDILLIFFAGHGVMEGEKKQFYFLTADASKTSAAGAVADVGISTAELTEWMKPQNIKAQKRILIFDACNSGQAIKDFVKMGTGDQNYVAARNDDNAQQIKAIDKLNEKSGLFILSASASNQSAYEMGRYSQGLLTYSLLKAIKQQPDILEDGKYLNISRWFNAAERTVTDLAKESGARQEPQIVTNTNFNIGMVDDEVMAKIILPQEKPLFAASNFQNNDEAIADDDLELSKQVNLQLNDIATRGTDSKIVYVTATNSPDAWSLSGRYEVSGNNIVVKINIKQNKEIKQRFEVSGTKDKLKELAIAIADKAAGMVK